MSVRNFSVQSEPASGMISFPLSAVVQRGECGIMIRHDSGKNKFHACITSKQIELESLLAQVLKICKFSTKHEQPGLSSSICIKIKFYLLITEKRQI